MEGNVYIHRYPVNVLCEQLGISAEQLNLVNLNQRLAKERAAFVAPPNRPDGLQPDLERLALTASAYKESFLADFNAALLAADKKQQPLNLFLSHASDAACSLLEARKDRASAYRLEAGSDASGKFTLKRIALNSLKSLKNGLNWLDIWQDFQHESRQSVFELQVDIARAPDVFSENDPRYSDAMLKLVGDMHELIDYELFEENWQIVNTGRFPDKYRCLDIEYRI